MAATGSSKKKSSMTLASNKVADDFQVVELVQNRPRPAGASFQASSNARTTARAARRNISRTEPCFITKQPSYALEIAHWANPVRKDLSHQQMIEEFLKRLGIVRHDFNLNDPSNLTNLDPTLHVCLDKFGFFAVTASLATLKKLITLVEVENRTWQNRFDDGMMYTRGFYLSRPPIVDAEYEMVVLHPEFFLPKGSGLTVFSQTNGQPSGKIYVVACDRTLRESPGTPISPRLPAFSFDADRFGSQPLNVFLVVLNAEIKFRRYKTTASVKDLSPDVQELIGQTIKLVDLIYWKPEVKSNPDNQRAATMMGITLCALQGQRYSMDKDLGIQTQGDEADEDTFRASRHRHGVRHPGVNATFEERKEYAQYLISGRDLGLDSDDEDLFKHLGLEPDF